MAERDKNYQLGWLIELDETYFGGPDTGSKRERGTNKAKVMVGVSLNEAGDPQFFKMEVITDLKGETINAFPTAKSKTDPLFPVMHSDPTPALSRITP